MLWRKVGGEIINIKTHEILVNNRLTISKAILEDKNLSPEAICVAFAINNILKKKTSIYYIDLKMIYFYLFHRDADRYEGLAVKKGFYDLVENEYISILSQWKNEYVCDLSKLYHNYNTDYFVQINSKELIKIMNLELRQTNKYHIFMLYIQIVSYFCWSSKIDEKYKGKIATIAFTTLSEITNFSAKTISNYLKILEENEMLYIIRYRNFNVYDFKNNIVNEMPNTYCRYNDKELALEYCAMKYNYSESEEKILDTSTRKSLGQKYAFLCKGREYSHDEIMEIAEYCLIYNKEQKDEYKIEKERGYNPPPPKKKSLDVFKKYLTKEDVLCLQKKLES